MDNVVLYTDEEESCELLWCDDPVAVRLNDVFLCQDDYDMLKELKNDCPECGKMCVYEYTCPTYPSNFGNKTVWMACQNCGNDVEWRCTDETCGWKRQVDSRNPRYISTKRPDWFDDKNRALNW